MKKKGFEDRFKNWFSIIGAILGASILLFYSRFLLNSYTNITNESLIELIMIMSIPIGLILGVLFGYIINQIYIGFRIKRFIS